MTRIILLTGLVSALAFAQNPPERQPDSRLRTATETLTDTMRAPDKGIPKDLLDKAHCVVVIPNLLKGAFLVGGQYGRGYATCRHGNGWTGPAAVQIQGGSFGFQLGGSATDLIMLVMNQNGMNHLLSDKFVLGGEAAAAAGPIGRNTSAETDAELRAEILTWSRSRGAFAGVSLQGATIHADNGENRKLYGHEVSNRQILDGEVKAPPAAHQFVAALTRESREAGNGPAVARANPPAKRHPADTNTNANENGGNNSDAMALNQAGGRMVLGQKQLEFASGQATLPQNADAALAPVAQNMKDHPDWKIRVEGYTDNTGNKAANLKLSQQRAEAVMNWLADHGVDRSRMTAKGYGEARPIGDNSNDQGRAENRRVEIVRTGTSMKTGE